LCGERRLESKREDGRIPHFGEEGKSGASRWSERNGGLKTGDPSRTSSLRRPFTGPKLPPVEGWERDGTPLTPEAKRKGHEERKKKLFWATKKKNQK